MTSLHIHKKTKVLTALSCSRYQEQALTSADSRHFVNSAMTNKSQRCLVDTRKRNGGRNIASRQHSPRHSCNLTNFQHMGLPVHPYFVMRRGARTVSHTGRRSRGMSPQLRHS